MKEAIEDEVKEKKAITEKAKKTKEREDNFEKVKKESDLGEQLDSAIKKKKNTEASSYVNKLKQEREEA